MSALKSSRPQILIIDDSLNNLHMLCATLKKAGYKTRGVKNSKMALMSIQACPPDLILLDIRMPGLDGYEVCQRLKANPRVCDIPVIFISALEQPIDLVKAFNVGGCDYITKPFQIEEVLARINHQLMIRTLEKKLIEQNWQLQSEIKQQEKNRRALQESQEKFSKAFLLSPLAMAIAHYPQGEFIDVNQAFLDITGYSKSEILGENENPLTLNLWVDTHQRDQFSTLLKTHQRIQNYEIQIKTKTGDQRTILLCAELLCLQDQLYVLCLLNDITEHKKMAQERNKVLTELQEKIRLEQATRQVVARMRRTLDIEQILRTITEDIRQTLQCDRVGIFRFNPDWSGEFIAESVTAGWQSLMAGDQTFANTLKSNRCTVNLYTKGDRLFLDTYLQATQGGRYNSQLPYICINDIEQSGLDPCYIDLLRQFQAQAYLIVPLFTETQLWGLLACYQNHSPRIWTDTEIHFIVEIGEQLGVTLAQAKLLERAQQQSQALAHAKNLAEIANQTKSEFLAKMTHELRTPLNAILGFTQILQQDSSLSSQVQDYLSIIHHSGNHLLSLINDILDMAKLESGKITLNPRSFNLHQFLDYLRQVLYQRAIAKGLTFEIICDPHLPQTLHADEGKLRQVLLNLLDNSLKFTATGTITLRVTYPSGLRFEVEDTGAGIATELLSTLFNPFCNSPSQEGTGLGLALSQRLVNLMGGQIQVKSQLGQGSRFSFEIPVDWAEEMVSGQGCSCENVIGLAPNQPIYRILVVEDNWANRHHLVNLLQSVGFEVREATQGQEAIGLWQTWFPHLILMDVKMPGMDGHTVAQEIRATAQGQDTVMIALTPQSCTDSVTDLMTLGWDDRLSQPIQEPMVWKKLAEHLGVIYQYTDPVGDCFHELDPLPGAGRIDANQVSFAQLEQALGQMSPEWINQVYQAACKGSDLAILGLLDAMASQFPVLADQLAHWANNFEFDQIITLVEPFESFRDSL